MPSATVSTLLLTFAINTFVVFGCTEKDRLVRDLTQSYLKGVEPDPTNLKFGIAVLCTRFDKDTGDFLTNAWEKYSWNDHRLQWNPKDYNGIGSIHLPAELIWTPDFKLYNSLTTVEDRDESANVVIESDGTVMWIPVVVYRSLCNLQTEGTTRTCPLTIGSWTYDANTLKLQLDGDGVELTSYLNSTCPLAVDKATATINTKYYPCCKEPYSSLEVNLVVKPQFF